MSELSREATLLIRALLDKVEGARPAHARPAPCPTCGHTDTTLIDRATDVLRSVRTLLEAGEPSTPSGAEHTPSRAQQVTIR